MTFDPINSRSAQSLPVHTDQTTLKMRALEGRIQDLERQRGAIVEAPLDSGWTNFDAPNVGWDEVKVLRVAGLVLLSGMVQGGSGTILTLPVGVRPPSGGGRSLIFPCQTSAGPQRVDVLDTGEVVSFAPSGAWVSLSGIVFQAGG